LDNLFKGYDNRIRPYYRGKLIEKEGAKRGLSTEKNELISIQTDSPSVQVWDLKKVGPKLSCTFSRLKICAVPPVPCERKLEACKFLSAHKFVRTRVNGPMKAGSNLR